MFGPSNYTLPLNEAQGNEMQLQTDVEMKVVSEYTEEISSSVADDIIEYEIITVGQLDDRTFPNLENSVPIDAYNDNQDSNSRCKMSIIELSPSYNDKILSDGTFNDNQDSISSCKMCIEELSPSSNTNHVFKVKSKNLCLDYNDKILSEGTFNDNQVSISRCKIEELSPSSNTNNVVQVKSKNLCLDYNDKILSDGTFNDNQDSISSCKMCIKELSPSSNTNHVFKVESKNLCLNYNDKILSDGRFNDNQDSISSCKMSVEELSPSSNTTHVFKVKSKNSCLDYNDKILSDGTFNDNQDSISSCKMCIKELSPSSNTNHVFKVESKNSCLNYNDKILSDGRFNDNQDSISSCKMSVEELSPSSNTTHVFKVKSKNSCLDYNDKILSDGTFNDNQDSISSCKMCIKELTPSSNTNHVFKVESKNSCLDYNDKILSDGTFNDNQDSISSCKMSVEELSPSSNTTHVFKVKSKNLCLDYNDKILSEGTFNDNQVSISRCKIEELSPSSNTSNVVQVKSKNLCLDYNDKILSDGTFNDNQDSFSRWKRCIEELSPSSNTNHVFKLESKNLCLDYNDKILSDGTFNDNQDSISSCKMCVEELSPSSNTNHVFKVKSKNLCLDYNDKILSDGTFNNNQDSISRCKMSIEELPPSSSTNHVFKVETENACLTIDHLIECVIEDTLEENKQRIEAEVNLDIAFRQCLIEMNSDLSNDDYNFDNVLKQFNKNDSSTETNHKRKTLHSDELIAADNDNNRNCSCGIPKEQSYFENTKKKRIGDEMVNISEKFPKSCKEIYHNIYFNRTELEYFKKTYKIFLQKSICLTLPPQIDKCIECCVFKIKNNLTRRDYDSITCRFYAFRQLRYQESGTLAVAGYPDPYKSIENIDLRMWIPSSHTSDPSDSNIQASTKILGDAGGQFCMFVKDEIDALKLNMPYNGRPRQILWKKCVNGVREMCDVCRTTIFNHHWCCLKCGFVVCIDCFKAKLKDTQLTEKQTIVQSNFNKKIWLLCSNQEEHQIEKLFITQILAGNALKFISDLMHRTCRTHNIPLDCSCDETLDKIFPPDSTVLDNLLNIYEKFRPNDTNDNEEETSGLKTLINNQYEMYLNDNDSTKGTEKVESEYKKSTWIPSHNVEETIYTVGRIKRKEWFPPKLSLLSNDKTHAPHMWLCEGHLLRLLDPKSDINYTIFQEQWRRGQPVLVSDVGNKLNSSLWHPQSFSRDFGNQINDLINCTTSNVISDQPMSKFWNGFENSEERLCDNQGNVMLLKLKDWPPSADFAETLPDRFQDLMNCLPLKEYTHRNGKYNLASRLPDCYVRPDLGPKMYTAYGNAGTKDKQVGTTNLHLDISDAVNVMVYVAITKNCKKYDYDWHVREALQVIEEAGCDDLTLRRIYVHGETPGALWHIYHASDADSIRDLLIKVAVEHGTPLEQFSDPIHDQSHYLDEYLRERLYREYGVKGYAIVQYYGDAVFIPAGAPHQVRNLHNCIKVAEDFVSPENVHHSFRMTQEFRHLTDSHTNHEDKLQIKNIVFHAVKDSIAVLTHTSHKL